MDKWELISKAIDTEFDNQYEFQANITSKWFVGVRENADGRAIVYATYLHSSQHQGARGYSTKRGVLLPAECTIADVVNAIKEVCSDMEGAACAGEDNSRWQTLSHDCVADLPVQVL